MSYVREIAFEAGRCDRLSPLIRRVIAGNPGPFTYTGTGTYLVGEGKVAVIDPGPDLDEHLNALMTALQGERVVAGVLTHTHRDHSSLSAKFKSATGATIYGPEAVILQGPPTPFDGGFDQTFVPDTLLGHGDLVQGPGWTLRAIATPGHASNHLCYALQEENALFSGDHIMGWATTAIVPPDGDMGAYYDSLRKIEALGFSRLYPTHGPPVDEVAPLIKARMSHRLGRERQILEQIQRGRRRISEMVPNMYGGVDTRLHMAAGMSILAHLMHLVETGRVVADGRPTLESEFRLAA